MARIKVKLQDTVPPRFVWIDPDATKGATLGTNVFLPDGSVGTPKTVREWLGVEAAPDPREPPPANRGVQHHRLLQGLTLGDDHPQYTQWVQNEIVTGSWHFRQYNGILIENPDYLEAGIELITFSGPDPLNDGIGNQLAFWEVGVGGAFTSRSYGFRIRHTGDVDLEGNLDFYRHQNDVNGVLFMRFTRDSSQVQFAAGTAAAPVWTTFNDLNTGMYFPAADQIGFSAGGGLRLTVASASITGAVPFLIPDGSAVAPGLGFSADANSGFYRISSNLIAFATSGIERLRIGNGTDQFIRSSLVYEGPTGAVGAPTFSFSADQNTGMYSVGADQLGFTTAGTLRLTLNTAALISTLPLQGPAGSVSNPTYSFSTNTDTGVFLETANRLSMVAAGELVCRYRNESSVKGMQLIGQIQLGTALTPAQITANQNDYDPEGGVSEASVYYLSSDASRNITGIATANLLQRALFLVNVGSFDIVLVNASALSAVANRFNIGANITIGPNEGVTLLYQSSTAGWRCVGKHV